MAHSPCRQRARYLSAIVVPAICLLGPLASLQAQVPQGPIVRRSPQTGLATFVSAGAGGKLIVQPPAPGARAGAANFLNQYGPLFGVKDAARQLVQTSHRADAIGFTHTSYHQVHQGVRVFAGVLRIHQDGAGDFVAANGHIFPIPDDLSAQPTVAAAKAEKLAREIVAVAGLNLEKRELVIVDPGWYGDPPIGPRLAWYIILVHPVRPVREALFIDARSGAVLDRWNMIHTARDRRIYDGNGTMSLPGTLVRTEGQPPVALADANRAYDYAGDTYDYLLRAFGRDGLDGNGSPLLITVNSTAPDPCPNAFWNGTRMVFCSGTVTDDIMAHELAHGVTQHTADLIYQNQPGQLNESYSDIIGEMVDLFNGNAAFPGTPGGSPSWPTHPTGPGLDAPNNLRPAGCTNSPGHVNGVRWLLGEDATAFGGAIRDMWNPPCYSDPDRANSPLQTCNPFDSGGVHSGSGVPNHAFAMMTDGKTFNGQTVTGIGPIKAAAVWYRALSEYLTPTSDFSDAYAALNQAAADLVGTFPNDPRTGLASVSPFTAPDAEQVDKALLAAEMDTNGACGGNPEPELTLFTPNGGESFGRGRPNYILWSSVGGGTTVRIDLLHNGSLHSNIVSGASNVNAYVWDIPADLVPDENYRIRIFDGVRTDESNADFAIIDYNDACAAAICVLADEIFIGQTTGASGTDISSCTSNDFRDVWHLYSPTVSGPVTISTAGSEYDTSLAVYSACGGTQLACNDDAPGTLSSRVTLNMTAGLTYFIRVSGYAGDNGIYRLLVTGGAGTCEGSTEFLVVASPEGGAVWEGGATHSILWTSVGGGPTVTIDLLKGADPVLNIVTGSANTGLYAWTIPADQPVGTDYRIRITDGVSTGTSDEFTIDACSVAALSEDFETGLGVFTIDNSFGAGGGLWHMTTTCRAAEPGHSPTRALYYGIDAGCNYNGGDTEGVVTSNALFLSPDIPAALRFSYYLVSEGDLVEFDIATVEVSADGGPYTLLASNVAGAGVSLLRDPSPGWHKTSIDLTAFAGSTIRIRFRFRTGDGEFNNFPGFYVDDVRICTSEDGCPVIDPPSNCIADPDVVCPGQSAILTATPGAGGDTIDWFTGSCGQTPVPGGANPVVSPAQATTYYARTRDTATGCLSATCCEVTLPVASPPSDPANPLPATGAADVVLLPTLRWGGGACQPGSPVTNTFDGIPLNTPVNGLVIGDVTFGFSSPDAIITDVGPGFTALIRPPSIEGERGGTLTLGFASPVYSVAYNFALSSGFALSNASAITAYDADLNLLGIAWADAANHGFGYVEGQNVITSAQGIARAVITFTHELAIRFALDDLVTSPCAGMPTAAPAIVKFDPPGVTAHKREPHAAIDAWTIATQDALAVEARPAGGQAVYDANAARAPVTVTPPAPAGASAAGGCLVINGDFEAGLLVGWTVQAPSSGGFVINNGALDPVGPDGPLPPSRGNFSVVTNQTGSGTRTLYQDITLPPDVGLVLKWTDMLRNHASEYSDPIQEFRVEIRDPSTNVPLATVFSTNPGDPLLSGCTARSVDITAFAGQTIRLAFVEQDGLQYFNVHLDDICIETISCPPTYDVYVDTVDPPLALACDDAQEPVCDPGPLNPGTTYFWRVVASNCCDQAIGPVWSFTTTDSLPAPIAWRSHPLHVATHLGIELDPAAGGNGLSGASVETRAGGIQSIRIDFSQPVSLDNTAGITLVGRMTSGDSAGPPVLFPAPSAAMLSPATIELTFAGAASLPDRGCYTITLPSDVTSPPLEGDLDVNVRGLYRDTTGSGDLTLSDVLVIKSKIGTPAAEAPHLDLDLSGVIDMSDVLIAKSGVGTTFKALCE